MSSYSYSRENKEMPLENVKFQHFYEVQRFGISPIEQVALTMRIPTHWRHSGEDIAIANINNIVGMMDGLPFYCDDFIYTDAPLIDDFNLVSAALVVAESSRVADNSTRVNFISGASAPIDVPSSNRMLYVNCTNDAVQCQQVNCKVGPFESTLSVAKLLITLHLQVQNFHGKYYHR